MSNSLREIAENLLEAGKKVQLIYAFNGTGKTRLSREFKELIAPKNTEGEDSEEDTNFAKILYYNAFTEDLFYWDNDLTDDQERKLKIQPNDFTNWVLRDQGQDRNVIGHFQRYSDEKLTPHFNDKFSEVTFSFQRGNEDQERNVKLSKGEESNFIWSVFYSILDQVVDTLNIPEKADRDTDQFNELEYIFIDDPVSSLDENHLIELAVDLASVIKRSNGLKFVITTHNPLFYNVLHNEFSKAGKYVLKKYEDGSHDLMRQNSDSPFSYHLYLKAELEKAISSGQIRKYHFNFLRNLLEKTSSFLGYDKWAELLPGESRNNPYEARMINLFSHSKHSGDEVAEITDDEKRMLKYLVEKVSEDYSFKETASNP